MEGLYGVGCSFKVNRGCNRCECETELRWRIRRKIETGFWVMYLTKFKVSMKTEPVGRHYALSQYDAV